MLKYALARVQRTNTLKVSLNMLKYALARVQRTCQRDSRPGRAGSGVTGINRRWAVIAL